VEKKIDFFEIIRRKPLLSLMIGGVMFLVGILISDLPRMIVSPGWPTTEGTIVSNRILGSKIKLYDGTFYTDDGTDYTNYKVYIRYQYFVDGSPYASRSVNAIDALYYPASLARRYPVGNDVIVYYNPQDPGEAVLEPGFVNVSQAFDVFSYFFFGVGIIFIYLSLASLKKSMRENHQSI
jgi:hypothetical protein